jgi:succinate dehydrogenase hydrophobic anchor subunit
VNLLVVASAVVAVVCVLFALGVCVLAGRTDDQADRWRWEGRW